MSHLWQAAALAAESGDRNAVNGVPTDAHYRQTIKNIQLRNPIRKVVHPMLEQKAKNLKSYADGRRDKATSTRSRYRIVLNNYANALPSLRDHATQMVAYTTMIIQGADWLDTIAEKLENAARSPRPAADIWETLAWTSEYIA